MSLHSPRFHKWAVLTWATVGTVVTLTFPDSILWVALMSLYANIASHWSAYQAARAEHQK